MLRMVVDNQVAAGYLFLDVLSRDVKGSTEMLVGMTIATPKKEFHFLCDLVRHDSLGQRLQDARSTRADVHVRSQARLWPT